MEELALLYEAMATRGFTPREVDELELWECAAVLGQARPASPEQKAEEPKPAFDQLQAHKERMRARELGLPPPAPPPPSTVRLGAAPTVGPPSEEKGA